MSNDNVSSMVEFGIAQDWEIRALKVDLQALIELGATVWPYNLPDYRYGANPALTLEEVKQFERQHHITLSVEYREFLMQIGNGGSWPGFGQAKLGDGDPWVALGDPAEPFPHAGAWNDDPHGEPAYDDAWAEDPDYAARRESWCAKYFANALLNGAIPLADEGCGRSVWLVVTGPRRGSLWYDARVDRQGIFPLLDIHGHALTFLPWFRIKISYAVHFLRRELDICPQPNRKAAAALGKWTRVDQTAKEMMELEFTEDTVVLCLHDAHGQTIVFSEEQHGLCQKEGYRFLILHSREWKCNVEMPVKVEENRLTIWGENSVVEGRDLCGEWYRLATTEQ